MQFTVAAPVDKPSRPKGLGLTALSLSAFALIACFSGLFPPDAPARTLADLFSSAHLPNLFSGIALLAIELFTIWSYWKGEDWGRIFVLIASFLIAAGEISKIADGNLVMVMSYPVLFLRFALVVFLLYWLNTRPLRAWFKNAPPSVADLVCAHLVGRLCTAIGNDDAQPNQGWHLAFEHDAELTLNCPWRIVMDDNLAFASTTAAGPDTGNPADEEMPRQLLQNLRVKNVRVTPRTSDLFITFEMGIELQTWSADLQTQQWRFSDPILTVIADSEGLDSRAIPARFPTEDSAPND